MFEHSTIVTKLAGLVFIVALLAVPPAGAAACFEREVETCVPLEEFVVVAAGLNGTVRGHGGSEPSVFAVEVPEAGIVMVELTVPGSAPADPKLALVSSACNATWGDCDPTILSRSVSRLLLAVGEPATYFFRAAAQDPLMSLGSYRLTTGFVALDVPTAFDSEGYPDEKVVRIKPKGDPDEEVIEIDPDSDLRYEVPLHPKLRELCRTAEIDDHADTFLCSTRLVPGREVAGGIGNFWGDDIDVFYLILEGSPEETLWTLSVETTGNGDTFGGLYDRHGHRLEADDDGGHGANFRVVKALAPGLYFVRVEGRYGAEAPYALRSAASRW